MLEKILNIKYICIKHTGSRYTETPPKEGTDDDYIVLVKDMDKAESQIREDGWEECLGANDSDAAYNLEQQMGVRWTAWRKGEINVIITANVVYYVSSLAATELCKSLNIKDKELRIDIFRAVKFNLLTYKIEKWVKTL